MAHFKHGLLALLTLSAGLAADAAAVALYWSKTAVKTESVGHCIGFAATAMQAEGMDNIRLSSMEVAGTRDGAYAAITCFKTAPRASAIVMVAGEDLTLTRQLSERLQRRIAGVVRIDDAP